MDSVRIIQHATFGGEFPAGAAIAFTHIAGILSVHSGMTARDHTPFLRFAFDDIETSYDKIAELYIGIALRAHEGDIVVYCADDGQRAAISSLLEKLPREFVARIATAKMQEFIGQTPIATSISRTLLYLARPEEATARLGTNEGAVAELEDTKRAIINLLEDAREAQDKITAQAGELEKALEESRRLEHIAEAERATYDLLISSINEAIIVLDVSGDISIVNSAATTLIKRTRASLVGRQFSEAVHARPHEGGTFPPEFWENILHADKAIELPPAILTCGDDTEITAAGAASPIIDSETKERKGIIITFRDISKELALNEARINFISTASHQLRTPLTTIRWFAEMLEGGDAGKLTKEQAQYVAEISQGIERMANLVSYLLRTARVETGRARIAPEPISLHALLEECASSIGAALAQKGQAITIHGDDIPHIPLDADYAKEVFMNLLTNAHLYGSEGDTIDVSLELRDNIATVKVTDHGIGITKEEEHRVFEKFFRSERAIIASPDGSGLGLSFVRSLVADWGGEVSFSCDSGKSTTFTVTIPLEGMKARAGEVRLEQ